MNENREDYGKKFTPLFASYYFMEGLNISVLTTIVPIYILTSLGSVEAGQIGSIGSVVMLPWAIKLIYGILGDKYGSKKLGRRKPWIIFPGLLAGIIWALTPLFLLGDFNLFTLFTIVGIIGAFGFAAGDTSIDGLILDVVQREHLGRVQGVCWGFRSIGSIAGGPLLAIIFIPIGLPAEVIFIAFGGCTILISLLIFKVKEPEIPPKVDVAKNLKQMLTKGKNWKIFTYSIINSLTEGVIIVYISLYVLIKMGNLTPESATINAVEGDINLYTPQAIINLLVGIGIISGSYIGGYLSDKYSRQKSTYIGYIISISSALLLLIPSGPIYTLIIAIICGSGLGWRNSAHSPVLGEFARKYPEMDSTFFSLGNSFSNIGLIIGLQTVSTLFKTLGVLEMHFIMLYNIIFLVIAGMISLGPIVFALIKKEDYEIR